MVLEPGGLLAWIIVGAIAGWLAGQVMSGGGFGLIGDIIVGLIGAFIGGIVFGMVAPGATTGLVGSVLVAFVGAVILLSPRAVSDTGLVKKTTIGVEPMTSLPTKNVLVG